jgi:hypothetical protein
MNISMKVEIKITSLYLIHSIHIGFIRMFGGLIDWDLNF